MAVSHQQSEAALADALVESGLITPEDLERAREESKKTGERLGQTLIRLGIVDEKKYLQHLGEFLGIPYVELSAYYIDPLVAKSIPEEMARRLGVLPLFRVEDHLTVAMADPTNVETIDTLRFQTGCEIDPVLVSPSDLEQAITQCFSASEKEFADVIGEMEVQHPEGKKEGDAAQDIDAKTVEGEETPVVRFVNMFLNQAIRERASDIHIQPGPGGASIRFRVDGVLVPKKSVPRSVVAAIVSRIKIMSRLDITERRVPQDGSFRVKYEGQLIDCRVSTLPCRYGEKVVIRVLSKGAGAIGLEHTGLSPAGCEVLRSWTRASNGIILVTGPTGSGKSSTLYSVLTELNRPEVNIVTLEDPIEYELAGVTQAQVNEIVGFTFASGLRSILRQDPDIIMVGEMRDFETAETAIRAALTGHLVLSTLHTNDAPSAVTRLVDMGVEPFLVSACVRGVLAQRLVRRLCERCKKEKVVPRSVLVEAGLCAESEIKEKEIKIYTPGSCRECGMTGYHGRIGVFELMTVTESIQRLIVKRAPDSEIKLAAIREGVRTLRQDGLRHVLRGVTTIEEVLRVA